MKNFIVSHTVKCKRDPFSIIKIVSDLQFSKLKFLLLILNQPIFCLFQAYTPTSFDKNLTDLIIDNQRMSFVIWDTSGIFFDNFFTINPI